MPEKVTQRVIETEDEESIADYAAQVFEGRVLSKSEVLDVRWPIAKFRHPELPWPGSVLQLEPVELLALKHGSPPGEDGQQRSERRRANRARHAWRLTYQGRPVRVGLFDSPEAAIAYAEGQWSNGCNRGWVVVQEESVV